MLATHSAPIPAPVSGPVGERDKTHNYIRPQLVVCQEKGCTRYGFQLYSAEMEKGTEGARV